MNKAQEPNKTLDAITLPAVTPIMNNDMLSLCVQVTCSFLAQLVSLQSLHF